MKNRLVAVLHVLLVFWLLTGCAARQGFKSAGVVRSNEALALPAERSLAPARAPAPAAGGSTSSQAADMASVNVTDRMIIRSVEMSLVVEDTDKALEALRKIAADYKGYVSDSRKWFANEQPYAQITLRVEAGALDEVLSLIHGLSIRVESENISGQDVTEEYTDLGARLRNLEATEKELLALMTEMREKRGTAEDILAVSREITNVRAQIESLKGRMQYLERMTALATIRVSLRPKESPQPLVEKDSWDIGVTLNRALRAALATVRILATLGIYLIVFSPIILVPIFVIWLLVRLLRRGKKKGKGLPPASSQQ